MLPTHSTNRIYIAGPMTGIPEFNFPAFNAAAEKLHTEGWEVVNPADHGVIDGAVWSDYLRLDIPRLARCGAIYLLPGWENSRGARLEVHIAAHLGLEFDNAPDALDPEHHIAAAAADLRGRVCVPEGYVMVPVEPTHAMRAPWKTMRGYSWHNKYKAMLAAAPAPVERVEQEPMRKRFDQIEREVCEGKHTAASVFTQMRTAALYTTPQPAPTAAQDVAGLTFVRKILEKLERFRECAEDDEGVDIGRHWLDVLTRLGLLNRVQRSPARWEMTAQADDALEAAHQSGGAK